MIESAARPKIVRDNTRNRNARCAFAGFDAMAWEKDIMNYIDGFLIPVATADQEIYRAHEAEWWPLFKKHGALSLVVGWGDDVPAGKQTDFLRAVDLKEGETVVFCWMTWPDKETRNKAFAAVEAEMSGEMYMPFDGKRLVMGGFVPILQES